MKKKNKLIIHSISILTILFYQFTKFLVLIRSKELILVFFIIDTTIILILANYSNFNYSFEDL